MQGAKKVCIFAIPKREIRRKAVEIKRMREGYREARKGGTEAEKGARKKSKKSSCRKEKRFSPLQSQNGTTEKGKTKQKARRWKPIKKRSKAVKL